jgi:signal transduction histidine kinase
MDKISFVFPVLSILATLFMAFFIFAADPKKKINLLFFWMAISLVFWMVSNFSEDIQAFSMYSNTLVKLDFFFAPIAAYFFYLFNQVMPQQNWRTLSERIIIFIISIGLAILPFSGSLLIQSVYFDHGSQISFSPLIWVYGLLLTFILLFGCVIAYQNYRKTSGIERKQTLFLLIGSFCLILIVLVSNLILTNIFVNLPEISRLGFIGVLAFIVFCSYSILKHHLFDIKVILTEVAVGMVVMAVLIQIFLSSSHQETIIDVVIFILVSCGGYLLIKSVQSEIKKREQLESLSHRFSRANEKLEEDKEKLVELDKMKDEFLQMATHELNTPISVIQGKLSMIMDEDLGGFNPEQKKFLDSVSENSKRLAQMARDLLSVERIDQNRVIVTLDEVDLVEMASKIVADLVPRAKLKNDVLTLETPEKPLPEIMIDQNKITEVFNNLIVNATKFTENGTIKVKVESKDGQILVSISDTGIGIDKDSQAHLFEKFHQVGRFDPQNPIEQQGSGLGLYISKKLIELHHGKIWLESEPNHGTTFYFTLPIKQKDEAKNG